METKKFTTAIAKEIAKTTFGHVVDCIRGYSDSGYDLRTDIEYFRQNFEEDLEEMGLTITESRIEKISKEYEKMILKLDSYITKYYDKQ